jgi:hypothetical protein
MEAQVHEARAGLETCRAIGRDRAAAEEPSVVLLLKRSRGEGAQTICRPVFARHHHRS